MAIVHIAMFETLIATNGGGFQSYLNLAPPAGTVVAVGRDREGRARHARHRSSRRRRRRSTTSWPTTSPLVDDGARKNNGLALGQAAAAAILALRFNDGSQVPEPLVGTSATSRGNAPGELAPGSDLPDPARARRATGTRCLPFVITSADQFRAPVPPGHDERRRTRPRTTR